MGLRKLILERETGSDQPRSLPTSVPWGLDFPMHDELSASPLLFQKNGWPCPFPTQCPDQGAAVPTTAWKGLHFLADSARRAPPSTSSNSDSRLAFGRPFTSILTSQLSSPRSNSLLLDYYIQIFNAQDGNFFI